MPSIARRDACCLAVAVVVSACANHRDDRSPSARHGTGPYGGLTERASGSALHIDRFGVSGALPTHDVETVLALTGHTVWPCFEPIAHGNPPAEGAAVIHLGIDEHGIVTDVSIDPSPIAPVTIASCVDLAVRAFSFPASTGSSRVTWTVALERQR